eukprot:Rmarinus@m.26735
MCGWARIHYAAFARAKCSVHTSFGWFSPRHRIRIELVRHVYECISEEDVVFNTSPFAEDTHTVVPSDEPTNNDEEEELLLEKKPKRRFGRKKERRFRTAQVK